MLLLSDVSVKVTKAHLGRQACLVYADPMGFQETWDPKGHQVPREKREHLENGAKAASKDCVVTWEFLDSEEPLESR